MAYKGTGTAARLGAPTLTASAWADTALQLVAETRALTVSALATRPCATKGSFYWHFQGRSELLGTALARWEHRATTEAYRLLERTDRRLTSKSSAAWQFEKISIHAVLVVCLILTALLFVSWGTAGRYPGLERFTYQFQSLYGLFVVALLSGVVGVGLYPIGGTRVWCRDFCPLAAVLGLVQKFGRFRFIVKRDMCISCGLCSKNCKMGIDVRAYAQANTSFTRASCVGCGLCAEVCPRGVLRLERLVQIAGMR
jgi:NAD-dependent dihydropyrimidine dehydrogenase PreA subunit/AcrR family transcriptional regulator